MKPITAIAGVLVSTAIMLAQQVAPPTSRPVLTDAQIELRFESLRRSVQNLDDLGVIVARYENFLGIAQGSPVAVEVERELNTWRGLRDRGAKRISRQGREEWLDASQIDQLDTQAAVLALAAREQYLLGNLDAARELLKQASDIWPHNLSTSYLLALALSVADPEQAAGLFDRVRQVLPAHAPSLNNLAKLSIEAGKPQMAAVAMALALEASPGVQLLIDNARELLQQLPDNIKQSPAGLDIQRQLAQQEPALIEAQRKLGLERVGATWLDSKTLKLLKAQASSLEERLAPLNEQRQQLLDQIQPLARELRANIDLLHQLQVDVIRSRARSYPDSYYIIQARNNELRSTLDRLTTELNRVQAQIGLFKSDSVDQRLAGFTGQLQFIGIEGIPVKPAHLQAFERGFVPHPTTTLPTTQSTP